MAQHSFNVKPGERSPTAKSTPTGDLRSLCRSILADVSVIESGGGPEAIARQHSKSRMTVRERIDLLVDRGSARLELGLWAGYGMYRSWGGAPGAGVVTLI